MSDKKTPGWMMPIRDAKDALEEAVVQISIASTTGSPATAAEALKDATAAMGTAKRAIAYALDCLPEDTEAREAADRAERAGQRRIPGTGATAD